MLWQILGSSAIEPSDDDFDASYRVKLVADDERCSVVVEFQAPSAVASIVYAQEIARHYLQDVQPPERLVVDTAGTVTVGSMAAAGE